MPRLFNIVQLGYFLKHRENSMILAEVIAITVGHNFNGNTRYKQKTIGQKTRSPIAEKTLQAGHWNRLSIQFVNGRREHILVPAFFHDFTQ